MKKIILAVLAISLFVIAETAFASDYNIYLTKTSYISSDSTIDFIIEFPEGEELIGFSYFYDPCGNLITEEELALAIGIFNWETSPQQFWIPIMAEADCSQNLGGYCFGTSDSYPTNGEYGVQIEVFKYNALIDDYESVYLTDKIYFTFEGSFGESECGDGGDFPVCGDGVCSVDETVCEADNCCDGVTTDFLNDPLNCGWCWNVCEQTGNCVLGVCMEDNGNDLPDDSNEKICESEQCEEALICANALTAEEGCFLELIDIIPYIDKTVAPVLAYDDICSMKEKLETGDSIGLAVTAVLGIIDLGDNLADAIPGLGNAVGMVTDMVEGVIDCLEGLIYDHYLKPCGGYTGCLLSLLQEVVVVRGFTASSTEILSPATVSVVDDYGDPLTGIDGVLTFNYPDFKAVVVLNPEKIDNGYNVALEGTSSGTYGIKTTVIDSTGEVKKEILEENLPISDGEEIAYKIDVPEDLNPDNIVVEETEIGTPLNFTDLDESHWSYYIIMDLASEGIIKGYDDGTFKPDQPITRAELLKVAFEAYSDFLAEMFGSVVEAKENSFSDVSSSDWFYKYVTFAAYHYVVNGYSDGTFKPNQDVTRAEAVKIILLATGFDLPLDAPDSIFKDVPNDAWYRYFVMLLASETDIEGNPIITGYSDETFRPNQSITRAEASKLIKVVRDILTALVYIEP